MPKITPDKSKTYISKDGLWSIMYASGVKGPNMRTDGVGGYLKRGWYRKSTDGRLLVGPFGSLGSARKL